MWLFRWDKTDNNWYKDFFGKYEENNNLLIVYEGRDVCHVFVIIQRSQLLITPLLVGTLSTETHAYPIHFAIVTLITLLVELHCLTVISVALVIHVLHVIIVDMCFEGHLIKCFEFKKRSFKIYFTSIQYYCFTLRIGHSDLYGKYIWMNWSWFM